MDASTHCVENSNSRLHDWNALIARSKFFLQHPAINNIVKEEHAQTALLACPSRNSKKNGNHLISELQQHAHKSRARSQLSTSSGIDAARLARLPVAVAAHPLAVLFADVHLTLKPGAEL